MHEQTAIGFGGGKYLNEGTPFCGVRLCTCIQPYIWKILYLARIFAPFSSTDHTLFKYITAVIAT